MLCVKPSKHDFVTWNLRNITQWLEITQNVNTCVASIAHRDILNQIFYVVRRKMCFHLFFFCAHRLTNNVRLICNNINDNRQKGVSACICALLSLPLWHIIKFSPMTPLIMALLISYVMYYTHEYTLYICMCRPSLSSIAVSQLYIILLCYNYDNVFCDIIYHE